VRIVGGVRVIRSAVLFGALVFAVSFAFWVAAVAAVVVQAGGGGVGIFYAAAVLAALTGAMFGRSFWRHKRVSDSPYWERIFQRRCHCAAPAFGNVTRAGKRGHQLARSRKPRPLSAANVSLVLVGIALILYAVMRVVDAAALSWIALVLVVLAAAALVIAKLQDRRN
jgi:hypothetical protein